MRIKCDMLRKSFFAHGIFFHLEILSHFKGVESVVGLANACENTFATVC